MALYPGEETEEVELAALRDGDTLIIAERVTVHRVNSDHVVIRFADGSTLEHRAARFVRVKLTGG